MAQEPQNKWAQLDWLKGDGRPPAPLPADRVQYRAPERVEIEYRPPVGRLLLAMLFFAACGLFGAHQARTNDRGLIISRLIELSPAAATAFWGVLCVLSFGFVAAALGMFPRSFVRRHIVLEADAITIPTPGLNRRVYRIPREDIRSVSVQHFQKMRYVKFRHHGGVRPINSTWLPHEGDLDRILKWLDAS